MNFQARVTINEREDQVEDIDVFCFALTPVGEDRPIDEWILEHLQGWDVQEFLANFSLEKGVNHEIIFKGTIRGWYDHNQEWEEEIEVDESETQALPDDWFDEPEYPMHFPLGRS